MKSIKPSSTATCVGLLFAATVVGVSANSALPAVEHSGRIDYRTGGVGVAEAQAMKMAARNYPLSLEFVEQNGKVGEYSADEHVKIQDASNHTVFTATADGPFMLIDLPDGKYKMTASAAGHAEVRKIDLAGKPHDRVAFVWPAAEIEPKL